jgi:hypothetical protein
MCDGPDGSVKQGSQKGIALADAPSWAAGSRLMPQSAMHAMAVPVPYAPGTKVIAPTTQSNATQGQQASPFDNGMSFQQAGDIGQPIQTENTTIYSPLGNGGIGLQNTQVPSAPAPIPGQTGQFQPDSTPTQDPTQSVTTQGANPVTFQNAQKIQSALPQVQAPTSTTPTSNSSPSVSQAPSQLNPNATPAMTHDQALAQGLHYTLGTLEGGKPYREHNGRISVYGIGSDPDEPTPKNEQDATEIFTNKYINHAPQRADIMSQLNTPQDVNAYAQYVINAPAKADQFTNSYEGQVGGDQWRNSLLNHQALYYNRLVSQNPKKFSGDLPGWVARIKQSRSYNPTQQT